MLYKRGKIWWVKFKANGQTIQRSAGTTIKKDAAAVERELRTQAARHTRAGEAGIQRTYSEALIKWINSGAPESMWSHARNTRPYLDDIPLNKIIPAAHEMKADMLQAGLSALTINRRLSVVRRVLNLAYREWDWIDEPLGQKIKLLSEKRTAREIYLSQDEVDTLIAATSNPIAAAVITLAAYTGLRRGELLGFKPQQWQPPYIILGSNTKSGKPRTVPVMDEYHHLLKLVPFDISAHGLRVAFETARAAIDRPELRFHDLRHTYASWLVKDPTIPLTAIRDLLGHSTLSVTSKYAHLRGDSAKMVTGALGRKAKNEAARGDKKGYNLH